MANHCVVSSCGYSILAPRDAVADKPISLHRFPWKYPELARKWVANVIMSGTPSHKITHCSRVCSLHFENGTRTMSMDCIPTIFTPSTRSETETKVHRKKKRKRRGSLIIQDEGKTVPAPKHVFVSKPEQIQPVHKAQFSKKVVKNGFHGNFMSQISHFWKTKQFCDLRLVIGDTEVLAHQLVFNVARPFCLTSLSRVEDSEDIMTVVVPIAASREAIASFLMFMYEGSLLITDETVEDILLLGQHFRMNSVEFFCKTFRVDIMKAKGQEVPQDESLTDFVQPDLNITLQGPPEVESSTNETSTSYPTLEMEKIKPALIKGCQVFDSLKRTDNTSVLHKLLTESPMFSKWGKPKKKKIAKKPKETKITCSFPQSNIGNLTMKLEPEDSDLDRSEESAWKDPISNESITTEGAEATEECPEEEEDMVIEGVDDSQPNIVNVSWSDDNQHDEQWLVMPNESEDLCEDDKDLEDVSSVASHKRGDSDTEKADQGSPDHEDSADRDHMLESSDPGFIQAFSVSQNVYDMVGSQDVEVNLDKDKPTETSENYQEELDDSEEDVKPTLLPDGSILDTSDIVDQNTIAHTSPRDYLSNSEDESPERIKVLKSDGSNIYQSFITPDHDVEMDHAEDSEADFKPLILPDGSVFVPGQSNQEDEDVHDDDAGTTSKDDSQMIGTDDNDKETEVAETEVKTEFESVEPIVKVFEHGNLTYHYFKCDQCPSLFMNKNKHQEHVEVVHQGKRFVCQYCDKSFLTRIGHKKHESEHLAPNKNLKCLQCHERFNSREELRNHKGCVDFRCGTCWAVFCSRNMLWQHQISCRNFLECSKCGKTYANEKRLQQHLERHLCDEVMKTASKPVERFKCKLCGKVFTSKKIYLSHRTKMHSQKEGENKQVECPECVLAFKNISSMRRHFKSEHPKAKLPSSVKMSFRDLTRDNPFENEFDVSGDQDLLIEMDTSDAEDGSSEISELKKEVELKRQQKSSPDKTKEGQKTEDVVKDKPKRRKHKAEFVTGTKNFNCSDCGASFLFFASLRRHRKSEHTD